VQHAGYARLFPPEEADLVKAYFVHGEEKQRRYNGEMHVRTACHGMLNGFKKPYGTTDSIGKSDLREDFVPGKGAKT